MKPTFMLFLTAAFLSSSAMAQPAPPQSGMPPGPPPTGMPQGGPPPGGFPAMPSIAETEYVTAVEVRDGAFAHAATGAVKGKVTSATAASGLAIKSAEPALNALFVSGGKSAFTLRNSQIALSGPGTNDFLGTGAGAMVTDYATLVLDGVSIETSARICSAAVAAENATLRIYNSRLVANGGPLPADYKSVIGPGMMEPPAPLGLSGTARTLLAMSNSRTYIYDSYIEADGWGALSTDATGGNLYLEANDSTIVVRKVGYGTYADFGAHVAINRSRIESGGDLGIIAGKARIDFDQVSGRAGRNGVMIHTVMSFDVTEMAELSLMDSSFVAAGPVVLVKSANAKILIEGGTPLSTSGVLLEVRKNDDPNATRTNGANVPGVHLTIRAAQLAGDVLDTDPDRETTLALEGASLGGALRDVNLSLDAGSHWTASGDSSVVLVPGAVIDGIDAAAGIKISARASDLQPGRFTLPSGGVLVIAE